MVVSNIFYFHPYFGKIPILTNIFQMGWFNHQLGGDDVATVLYGELSPHTRGSELARLAFYENEQCQRSLAAALIFGGLNRPNGWSS